MKRKTFERSQVNTSKQNSSLKDNFLFDEQIESKMRILANYLIDHVLGEQQKAKREGLNINLEKGNLIMEHKI